MENLDVIFEDLKSKDNKTRQNAFQSLLKETEQKVDWIYIKWDDLVDKLDSENSFQRSIGLLLLANLCKSDTDNKFGDILERYLRFFDDEKFITSRQFIQNVWKIAIENESFSTKVLSELQKTYYENAHINKHGNLIKQNVISSMFLIYKSTKNENIHTTITDLIDSENDAKLRKALGKVIVG